MSGQRMNKTKLRGNNAERMWRRLARYTSVVPVFHSPKFRVDRVGQGGKLLIQPVQAWGCGIVSLLLCGGLAWALSEFQWDGFPKWALVGLALFFAWIGLENSPRLVSLRVWGNQ